MKPKHGHQYACRFHQQVHCCVLFEYLVWTVSYYNSIIQADSFYNHVLISSNGVFSNPTPLCNDWQYNTFYLSMLSYMSLKILFISTVYYQTVQKNNFGIMIMLISSYFISNLQWKHTIIFKQYSQSFVLEVNNCVPFPCSNQCLPCLMTRFNRRASVTEILGSQSRISRISRTQVIPGIHWMLGIYLEISMAAIKMSYFKCDFLA